VEEVIQAAVAEEEATQVVEVAVILVAEVKLLVVEVADTLAAVVVAEEVMPKVFLEEDKLLVAAALIAAILDLLDHPVNLDNLDHLETLVPLEDLEILVAQMLHHAHQLLHHRANHVVLDHPDHLAHLVDPEMLDNLDHLDKEVVPHHQDHLDQKDHLDNPENLANLEALDKTDHPLNPPQLHLDPQDHLVMLDHPVHSANLVLPVKALDQDQPDPKDHLAHPDPLATPEMMVDLVKMEYLDKVENKEFARNIVLPMVVSSLKMELVVNFYLVLFYFCHFCSG